MIRVLIAQQFDLLSKLADALAIFKEEDRTPVRWEIGSKALKALTRSLAYHEVMRPEVEDRNEIFGLPFKQSTDMAQQSTIILFSGTGDEIHITAAAST